jgi:hypothetical protein
MLPDSDHGPTLPAQQVIDQPVPRLVAFDFLGPEHPSYFRNLKMGGAAMPKASVNKNNHPLPHEGKVRATSNLYMPTPSDKPVFS